MTTNNNKRPSLTFRTRTQVALFVHEISGQISDGHWENASPRNHWKAWGAAEILVGPAIGRDFYANRDYYGLTSPQLLDVVGERMLAYARMALVFDDATVKRYADDFFDLEGNLYTVSKLKEYASEEPIPVGCTVGDGFWSKRLAKLEAMSACELYELESAVNDPTYGMKQLRADLREMSKAMRVVKPHYLYGC